MKKFSIVLLLGVLFFVSVPASAQFKWGVEGGLHLGKASLSADMFDASNRTGWFIGPKVQFTMPVLGLGVDGALLYSQKYLKFSADGTDSEIGTVKKDMPYIEIPINLRWNVGFSSLIGAYIATGPQFSWYLGGGNLSNAFGKIGSLKSSTFSWNVGAGLNLINHVQLGFSYNIALGETGQIDGVAGVIDAVDIKNNVWQIRLAYMF